MNYDVIVVGSGNSGLISAITLLNDKRKVLLLDSNNNIGGFNKGVVSGRFEFETSIHNLYFKDSDKVKNSLNEILNKCSIKDNVKFSTLNEVCKVVTPDKTFTIPFGIDNYIKMVEELVPGSEESLNTFFELAKECREALDYVVHNKDYLDYEHIKDYYNNFMRVSPYSVSKVLDAIGMPLAVQEIINALWIYFGSTETEISFVEYAVFLLNVIEYGLQVPDERSYGVSMMLANNFLERGGEIRLNSKVVNLILDDDKVNGVRLVDGTIYYADKVIVNSSLTNVYTKLIKAEDVPRAAIKNIQRRELGYKLFSVHLGLNRSVEELGLDKYTYILYSGLDSDAESTKMEQFYPDNQFVVVHNNGVKDISPAGTSMITLNTMFMVDCFSDVVGEENYYNLVQNMAFELIRSFEKKVEVSIKEYIEEIKIVTPLDNIKVGDYPDGSVFGYKLKGHDNLLPRILNNPNEQYIKGLYVCGGFDGDIYGYSSSLVSGLTTGMEAKKGDK